jgi:hypothetical protein
MDGTIIGQGTFSSIYTGANPNPGNATNQAASSQIIAIPSGVDWLKVYDYTKAGQNGLSSVYFNGTNNAFAGNYWYWQRGMAAGTGIVQYKSNGASTLNEDTLVSGGFTLYDPSGQTAGALPLLSAPVATTASTNATRPVVSTGNTAGLTVGSIVRLNSTAQTDVNGIDFVVGAVTANTSFTLLTSTNALATAPGAIGGAGFYSIVNYNTLFYPRRRYVVNITQANPAQVSTSIPHGMTAGQVIRFEIPSVSGMVQLNPSPTNNYQPCTVVQVIDDYNFTINVDTTSFTAFTWPTIAQQPSSFPAFNPVGEDTASALVSPYAQVPSVGGQQIFNTNTGILADSTVNTGYLGMILGGGGNGNALTTPITGPAGSVHFTSGNVIDVADSMYWVAGKSTYGGL